MDDHYAGDLAQKDLLIAERQSDVFRAEPETGPAQSEVLGLVVDHLTDRDVFPGAAEQDLFHQRLTACTTGDGEEPALQAAARLVQEDLVLMRKGDSGWRLAAASLCFPSSWSLAEKFGRPLADIHRPVPGFGAGTRPADLIERMFDRLQGQIVLRWNWSLQGDAALYRPRAESERFMQRAETGSNVTADDILAATFIRVERQTLRKLPISGDILFTIRIHLDVMDALRRHPECARLALSFADQLAELNADQLAYKGLSAGRNSLVATLRAVAAR